MRAEGRRSVQLRIVLCVGSLSVQKAAPKFNRAQVEEVYITPTWGL